MLARCPQIRHPELLRLSLLPKPQAAGLEPGDFVLAVDGEKVASLEAFYKRLWARGEPDSEISLTVLQGADVKTIKFKAVDRMTTMTKPAGI